MRRRKWDAKPTAMIVLQGLQGRPVAEICHAYPIGHSQYYLWRAQLLAHAPQAFAVPQHTRTEARLAHEHTPLKKLGGALIRA